jgi:D-aspartate ligase
MARWSSVHRSDQAGRGLVAGAIDSSTPIFVLRREFAGLQHAVLCASRSAGRLGVPVYGVRMARSEPAVRSRYFRGGFDRLREGSDQDWLSALVDFDAGPVAPMLLPIDEVSAVFADDHYGELSQRFLMPKAPPGVHRRLASKREVWELTQELGVPTPVSIFPTSEAEVAELSKSQKYPVVLKRADPWLPSYDPHAPSVLIAGSPMEMITGYRRMESPERPQVMVQEYIPGGPDSIWMFNGYFGQSASECLCAFTGQKIRQRGPQTGSATLGVCVWNQGVADAAIRLIQGLGYTGIVDMGFRYDARDDQYKLLDVNPRMGSTFRLFVGDNGLDVLRAQYLDLTGQQVPPTRARDGRKWVVEPYDLVGSLQMLASRRLSPSGWVRSLRGVEEAAWWARDDPLPALAMGAALAPEAFSYRVRSRRRRQVRRLPDSVELAIDTPPVSPAPGPEGAGSTVSEPERKGRSSISTAS